MNVILGTIDDPGSRRDLTQFGAALQNHHK